MLKFSLSVLTLSIVLLALVPISYANDSVGAGVDNRHSGSKGTAVQIKVPSNWGQPSTPVDLSTSTVHGSPVSGGSVNKSSDTAKSGNK